MSLKKHRNKLRIKVNELKQNKIKIKKRKKYPIYVHDKKSVTEEIDSKLI